MFTQQQTPMSRSTALPGLARRSAFVPTWRMNVMGITRDFQPEIDEYTQQRRVAQTAANTRRLGYAACSVCGCRATFYVERDGLPATFRCKYDATNVPGTTHIEPIREQHKDLVAELRFQGRVKLLLLEDESRRDREANGEGVMTVEELALLGIAYDRALSAEDVARRFLAHEPLPTGAQ